MDLFQKLHGSFEDPTVEMAGKAFFIDENVNGYILKEDFLIHLKRLNRKELSELDLFHEYLKNGLKMNSLPIIKEDRLGRAYIWCSFIMPKSQQGFKVLIDAGLAQFVKDYQQGKIKVSFTLNDLIDEASSADGNVAA